MSTIRSYCGQARDNATVIFFFYRFYVCSVQYAAHPVLFPDRAASGLLPKTRPSRTSLQGVTGGMSAWNKHFLIKQDWCLVDQHFKPACKGTLPVVLVSKKLTLNYRIMQINSFEVLGAGISWKKLFNGLFPFLPDLFPVYWSWIVGAEWDQCPVRSRIMDTAPLDTTKVVIITVHEMHRADKECIPVELS